MTRNQIILIAVFVAIIFGYGLTIDAWDDACLRYPDSCEEAP